MGEATNDTIVYAAFSRISQAVKVLKHCGATSAQQHSRVAWFGLGR